MFSIILSSLLVHYVLFADLCCYFVFTFLYFTLTCTPWGKSIIFKDQTAGALDLFNSVFFQFNSLMLRTRVKNYKLVTQSEF